MFSKGFKQKGKDDYTKGLLLEDNPFLRLPNPAKSGWWEAGWLEARREATDK